jgi:hypothetical protein
MARDDVPRIDEEQFKQRLRRALATPPISNEEIERRSKQQRQSR